jgi:hypothetical protein
VHGKVTKQYRSIRRKQKRKVAREVEEGIRLFETGSLLQGILVLRRTAEGCRWLKAHWAAVRDRLARYGLMTELDLNFLLKLYGKFGVNVTTCTFQVDPEVAELVYLARGTWPTPTAIGPEVLRVPPAPLLQHYQALWPTPQAHRDELLWRIDAAIAELDARIAELEADEEAELEDESLDAMMITDAKEADLCLRYTREADTALEKALKTFWALQERKAATADPEAATAEDVPDSVAEDESPPPEAPSEAPAAETAPDDPSTWPEDLRQMIAGTVEGLVEITQSLAPDEAWDYVQQSVATLPPGPIREAVLAAAQARFPKEPGDVSQSMKQQGGYVASPGYHAAVLAGLREIQRGMAAMAPSELLAEPALQH